MDVPTACEDCLGRLFLTEPQSLDERWVPADEWDVKLGELKESASKCAICKIHLEAAESEEQEEISALNTNPSLDVDSTVAISLMWLTNDEMNDSADHSDLTRLIISDKPYDIFAYPGEIAYISEKGVREFP